MYKNRNNLAENEAEFPQIENFKPIPGKII